MAADTTHPMATALSSVVGVQCRRMRPCTFRSGLSSVGTVAHLFVYVHIPRHGWPLSLLGKNPLHCPAAPSWAVTSVAPTAPTWASTVRSPLLPPVPAPTASSFLSPSGCSPHPQRPPENGHASGSVFIRVGRGME